MSHDTISKKELVVIALLMVFIASPTLLAAGAKAGSPITPAVIEVDDNITSCHINDDSDKVPLTAAAVDCDEDYTTDQMDWGQDSANSTKWAKTGGVLDETYGKTNNWKATAKGQKTVTVNFKDLQPGSEYDDDNVTANQTVIGFKVGVALATSLGAGITVYEDSVGLFASAVAVTLNKNYIMASTEFVSPPWSFSQAATWTAITDPANIGTNMKGDVGYKAEAKVTGIGGAGGGTLRGDVNDSSGSILGDLAVVITKHVGIVSFTFNPFDLGDDDTVSILGIGYGFSSQIHGDDDEKIEMSSKDDPQTTIKNPQHSPADATVTGKPNTAATTKVAEIECSYKAKRKAANGEFATAEALLKLDALFGVTATKPWYVNAP